MFAYCLNNPVCMADQQGEDAIYVVDFKSGRGLPVAGHALLFLQDAKGNWYKTELAGRFPDKSTARVKLESTTKKKIDKFLASGLVRSVRIAGDFSASYRLAKKYAKSGYGKYNLLTRNCLHYVKEILRAGTPKNSADWLSFGSADIIPAVFYSTLMNNRVKAINQKALQSFLKGVRYAW